MKENSDVERDFESMCRKGKACVQSKVEQGENRPEAVIDCWKRAPIAVEDDEEATPYFERRNQ